MHISTPHGQHPADPRRIVPGSRPSPVRRASACHPHAVPIAARIAGPPNRDQRVSPLRDFLLQMDKLGINKTEEYLKANFL